MLSSQHMRVSGLVGLILWMAVSYPSLAVVTTHGEFVASDQCSATLTLQGLNPGKVQLEPGRAYRALALDVRGSGWIRIIVPDARPRVRWADLDCGEYRADEGTLRFNHFFDQLDNPLYVDYPRHRLIDVTPPPPTVTPLEERLLALCGYPGDYPEPGAFRSLIESDAALFADLTTALGCPTSGADCGHQAILDRVTDLWFLADGFRRVFCGAPGPTRIDGPHYRAAYLQFQRRGWAGIMAPYRGQVEVLSGILYSVGVEHEWRGRRVQTHASPGYFYTLDGPRLLTLGTRAITLLGTPVNKQECRYTIKDPASGTNFHSIVVGEDGGLKTFYPTVQAKDTLKPCE